MVVRVCQEAYVEARQSVQCVCVYQLDIGAGAFKRAFVTHRNAVITAVKRIYRTSDCNGREKEEVFKEDLQIEQKHIGKWREAIEAELKIRHSETYRRPSGARYLVGSTLAPMCKSRYPVHFVTVDVKSTRTIVDQAFSVPKCVRSARMSERSYELYVRSEISENVRKII